jgi:hypothetical protein
MLDDRGNVVIRRIHLLGDVNHLARQLALAIGDESSEILSHAGLLRTL